MNEKAKQVEAAETSSALTEFDFENHNVRTVLRDGQPWFIATDLCEILGIKNSRDTLALLDDDEKGVDIADTLGGPQKVGCVNESGLYHLIFKSRKPAAKRFRKWVTTQVLPEIRKTGRYEAANAALPKQIQFSKIIGISGLLIQAIDKVRDVSGEELEDIDMLLALIKRSMDANAAVREKLSESHNKTLFCFNCGKQYLMKIRQFNDAIDHVEFARLALEELNIRLRRFTDGLGNIQSSTEYGKEQANELYHALGESC